MSKDIKIFEGFNQIASLRKAYHKDGRKLLAEDLDLIEDATIVCNKKKILWVGKTQEIPKLYRKVSSKNRIRMQGFCATPELVDSHTHTVFGGDRSHEYALRLNGATYEQIAAIGGGILSSVKSTENLSEKQLFNLAAKRIQSMQKRGVGAIEIKSGYGLSYEQELKISLVIDQLKKHFQKNSSIKIFRTYLAAHAVPKQYAKSSDYIQDIVLPLLIKLQNKSLIDAVDIFHEKNYFDTKDVEVLFDKAIQLKLATKIHADEFNNNAGALLAVKYKSLSADHLLAADEASFKSLAQSQTVATLLPGTGLFLGKKQAHARKLLDLGAKVAIASDFNPGSCHFNNLLLIASIMALNSNYMLNQAELWASITLNAAHALGYRTQGAIEVGLEPRIACFKTKSIDLLTYDWGKNQFSHFLQQAF